MAGKSRHNRDQVIVEALARGETRTSAARLAGCGVRTVSRRLESEEFRERVFLWRSEMLQTSASRLGANLSDAIETLQDLLKPEMPPAIRLGAARSIAEFALKTREATILEGKINELKTLIERRQT
jgi:hypothetical protein